MQLRIVSRFLLSWYTFSGMGWFDEINERNEIAYKYLLKNKSDADHTTTYVCIRKNQLCLLYQSGNRLQ